MEIEKEKNLRDQILFELEKHLNSEDKRFMFLKIFFPESISEIKISGSNHAAAWDIYGYFQRQRMLGSLSACVNTTFNTNINMIL